MQVTRTDVEDSPRPRPLCLRHSLSCDDEGFVYHLSQPPQQSHMWLRMATAHPGRLGHPVQHTHFFSTYFAVKKAWRTDAGASAAGSGYLEASYVAYQILAAICAARVAVA